MSDTLHVGDPARVALGISWFEDREPPERRPAGYGWSMGHLTIHVAGVNVTATRLDGSPQPHVGWYLAPFLDWLATNWVALLHEERYPWPNRGGVAALACNRALEDWMTAADPRGRQHYANAQDWYCRHGVRSAAAGGIFPDLFIRRVADDIELSWSGRPMEFTQDGLAFESGTGHTLLSVGEVADTIWQVLDWAAHHPPISPVEYHGHIAALRAKVECLREVDYPTLASAYAVPAILKKVTGAFAAIGREDLLDGGQAANEVPYIAELPPAVAMFGGVSPDLGTGDVEYLRDQIAQAQGGGDNAELASLMAEREYNPLGVPYQDGHRFADELLEDLTVPASDFVDVRGMCSRLGIDVEEVELETGSIRGVAIAGTGFAPRIRINQAHHFNGNESGRRFTIAHELCHVLFDRTRARRVVHASSGPWAAQGIEQRANAFAAYLLMPRELVFKHLPDANRIERRDVQHLVHRLQVNETALLNHLVNLGLIDDTDRDRLREAGVEN